MLTGLHFILTYTCNFECDHCFLHSSPVSRGTFTISQVDRVLDQACKIPGIEWIFFEGGEPFLFFPLLEESIRRAGNHGFKTGLVTNAYGIKAPEDAKLWLEPLARAGLCFLNISNDAFHYGDENENPATIAHAAARELDMETSLTCIDALPAENPKKSRDSKTRPTDRNSVMFRGRAAEKLTRGLKLRPWEELTTCPYEDLESPSRVHVDAFGNVQVCQGISMGNMWQTPLSELAAGYRPLEHPVCGPLITGGPAALASCMSIEPEPGYVDECHFCYESRKKIIDRYPEFIAPKQVYNIENKGHVK